MALLTETWNYFLQDQERFLRLLGQHLVLSLARAGHCRGDLPAASAASSPTAGASPNQ
ncbi:MAG: hypothetical protein V9G19_11190 [Tetrasphaera sp.]